MNKITIFTTNTCAYCKMVKQYLTSKAFDYHEVNLDTNPDQREQVAKYTDALTVPVTVIERRNEAPKVIVGWQPQQLLPALVEADMSSAKRY